MQVLLGIFIGLILSMAAGVCYICIHVRQLNTQVDNAFNDKLIGNLRIDQSDGCMMFLELTSNREFKDGEKVVLNVVVKDYVE